MDTDRGKRQSVNAPGWKWLSNEECYKWWDGERYSARADWEGTSWDVTSVPETPPTRAPRPHATRLAWTAMLGLIFSGCAALVVGATKLEERNCSISDSTRPGGGQLTYTDASGAWLPWLVLFYLAGFGLVVWRWWAPDVRWIKVMSILGIVVAILVCPVVVFGAGAMNCGM